MLDVPSTAVSFSPSNAVPNMPQELKEFEVAQLLCVYDNIKAHNATLESLLAGEEIDYNSLENLIYAASRDLIHPEKFKCFNLIQPTGSSHFSAYIPNTYKPWPKGRQTFGYELTPKFLSTLNGWNHSRETHDSGDLSLLALKRIREGWLRSGITCERIKLALASASASVNKKRDQNRKVS